MTTLDSFITFLNQAEENSKTSQEDRGEVKEDTQVSLPEKHQSFKDTYQKLMALQESLDKLVATKEKEDPTYDKYVDPVYANKAQEISSGLSKVREEAKKIGTILEANPISQKEPSNV